MLLAFPNEQLEGMCTLNKLISDYLSLDVLAASVYLLKSPAFFRTTTDLILTTPTLSVHGGMSFCREAE